MAKRIKTGGAASLRTGNLPVFNRGKIVATGLVKKSGQAIVYKGIKARSDGKNEDVAIKVYTDDAAWLDCYNECNVLSALTTPRHPNVMSFIARFKKPTPAIVMPYVKGGDLCDFLAFHGPMSSAQAVDLLRGIGEGLKHLHDRAVIHLDLKSQNILIGTHGDDPSVIHPIITDLGHGIIMTKGRESAKLSYHGYTPNWRAPEMIKQMIYSRKTDMYALGITMWEILAGEIPYAYKDGQWISEYVSAKNGRPDRTKLQAPGVMKEHRLLIEALWDKDPTHRPSVEGFLASIIASRRRLRKDSRAATEPKTATTAPFGMEKSGRGDARVIDLCSP